MANGEILSFYNFCYGQVVPEHWETRTLIELTLVTSPDVRSKVIIAEAAALNVEGVST